MAKLFVVDLSTIARLLQRFRATGSVQPKPHAGGPPPKLDAQATAHLLELVRQQPDATLAELRDRLGIACSIVTIFRALKRNGITRKKKTCFADERGNPRVQEQRRAFCQEMAKVDADHLVFVDEAGATTAMGRTFGRAPVGERVQATAPGVWKKVTLISGMRRSGVIAPIALPGAMDGERIARRATREPRASYLEGELGVSSRFFLIRAGHPLLKYEESQRIHQGPAERSLIPWLVKIRS